MQLSSVWSRIICKRIAGGINFLDSKDGYARGISYEREGEVLARDEDRARQRRQLAGHKGPIQATRRSSHTEGVTFFVSGHIQESLDTFWDLGYFENVAIAVSVYRV